MKAGCYCICIMIIRRGSLFGSYVYVCLSSAGKLRNCGMSTVEGDAHVTAPLIETVCGPPTLGDGQGRHC